MSINHFSSDSPETLWWAQQHHLNMEPSTKSTSSPKPGTSSSFICHQPNATAAAFWANSQICHHPIVANQNSALNFDLNNEDEEETIEEQPPGERENQNLILNEQDDEIPKEPLFEKPLTPSDVGKLNRLVIPKQHAEKYFPLSGNDSGEKGLLLSFEDESGKPWTFRYSYWNSSQSYVLTKGWSRFVKEKRLDAGDIVLFGRHRLDGDRLFVGWRRRSTAAATSGQESGATQPVALSGGGGGGGGWGRVYFSGHPYPSGHSAAHGHGPALPYQPDCLHAAAAAASVLQNQTTQTSANSKRLRLFGVNLECQQQPDESGSESEPPTLPDQGSSTWSQGQAQYQFQHYPKVHHAYFNHHNHMDINFSRDVNQTRYRQG